MNIIHSIAAPSHRRTPHCRRTPRRASRPGFTLADLIMLVVVVVLAGVIFAPTIGHADLTPNAAVCQASLRATGMANLLYADDNNDCMAVARATYGNPPPDGDIPMYHWFNLLSGYAGQQTHQSNYNHPTVYEYPEVFRGCPEFSFQEGAPWNPGYGMILPIYDERAALTRLNLFSEGNPYPWGTNSMPGRFWRRSESFLPAQQGWQGDSPAWHMGGDPNQTIYEPDRAWFPGFVEGVPMSGWVSADPQRHGNGCNVLFLDGHVEALPDTMAGWAFSVPAKLLHPGDFNGDSSVDIADYTTWVDSFGQTGGGQPADGNHNGSVDIADYTTWADNYGKTYSGAFTGTESATAEAAPALNAGAKAATTHRAASHDRSAARLQRQAARFAR